MNAVSIWTVTFYVHLISSLESIRFLNDTKVFQLSDMFSRNLSDTKEKRKHCLEGPQEIR